MCVAFPPAPCESVIRSSRILGLRARALRDALQHLLLAREVLGAGVGADGLLGPVRLDVGHARVASFTRSRLNRPKL